MAQQREPIPRFVHLSSYYQNSDMSSSRSSSSDATWYLQKVLHDGFLMNVDTTLLSMERIVFAPQILNTFEIVSGAVAPETTTTTTVLVDHNFDLEKEETALDPLILKVQDFICTDYRVLTAQHHPDYLGDGSGEYFFPLETGVWEQ